MSYNSRPNHERTARIRYLTPEEGGRSLRIESGVRSQLRIGRFQNSCVVERVDGEKDIPAGVDVDVRISILHLGDLELEFGALREVELREGSHLVATGSFSDRSIESEGREGG